MVSRAVLAGMGKQPVTWALASAPASASGRRGVVATDNPVAPASRLAVARAEGQVAAVEGCKAVGLVLSRAEDRPGRELSQDSGLKFPTGHSHDGTYPFVDCGSVGVNDRGRRSGVGVGEGV